MTRWFYLILLVGALSAAAGVAIVLRPDVLQEQVPIHFDMAMNADQVVPREEGRWWLTLYPGVIALLALLTWALPLISPRKFEVEPFRGTFDFTMLLVCLLFACLQFAHYWGAITGDMPARLWVGSFLLFWALLGSVMDKVQRNFWMGIRTPWTLASEAVWRGTHRLAARLWLALGALGFVAVLAGMPFWIALAALLISALYPAVYSLVLYNRLERAGKLDE
jgi:uncharacterized membrane protein